MSTITHTKALDDLVSRAIELGVKKGLEAAGNIPSMLNRSQAEKQYGKRNVKYWLENGMIKFTRRGEKSNVMLARHDLEKLAVTSYYEKVSK